MKRRTVDIILSSVGLVLAVLLAVLGLVLHSNATFAKNYVHDQLTAQPITFTPVAGLSGDEKQSATSCATPASHSPPASRPRCTPTTTSPAI